MTTIFQLNTQRWEVIFSSCRWLQQKASSVQEWSTALALPLSPDADTLLFAFVPQCLPEQPVAFLLKGQKCSHTSCTRWVCDPNPVSSCFLYKLLQDEHVKRVLKSSLYYFSFGSFNYPLSPDLSSYTTELFSLGKPLNFVSYCFIFKGTYRQMGFIMSYIYVFFWFSLPHLHSHVFLVPWRFDFSPNWPQFYFHVTYISLPSPFSPVTFLGSFPLFSQSFFCLDGSHTCICTDVHPHMPYAQMCIHTCVHTHTILNVDSAHKESLFVFLNLNLSFSW